MVEAPETPREPRWVRRPDDIAFVDDGEDRVAMLDLLHPADPPIVLEGTAAAIWRLLEAPSSTEELSEALADAYGVESQVVAEGVDSFVRDLSSRGLVVPSVPTRPDNSGEAGIGG